MVVDFILKKLDKDPTVKRHLLKTVSWRIIGSIDTVLLGWLITGKLETGAKIGGFELLTKMTLYFIHERVWERIKFGIPTRRKKAEKVIAENAANLFEQQSIIAREQREELNGNKSFTIWLTGLSGSGKSSIAGELDKWFYNNGIRAYVIDGDNTRLGVNSDLSFSNDDRSENIRRVAEICKLFNEAGIISIASFISPFEEDRAKAKTIIGNGLFIETFVDASIEVCKHRDTKGLYKLAELGKIKNFTGIDSPYHRPKSPDIHLHSDTATVKQCLIEITTYLTENKFITSPMNVSHYA
jgi:adenylylsulfate kinase